MMIPHSLKEFNVIRLKILAAQKQIKIFKRQDRKIIIEDYAKDINIFEEDNFIKIDCKNSNEEFDAKNKKMV